MSFNRKAKLRDNIEAIRSVLLLDKENRKATLHEQEILKRYCGFGGQKCFLNPVNSLSDSMLWPKSDLELFPMGTELHNLIRTNVESEQDYKQYIGSLKNSILTVFYIPAEVVATIAYTLRESGIVPDRFLDPSAGHGAFVSAFKLESANLDVMSIKKDLLTGKLLSKLYPDDKSMQGFDFKQNRFFVEGGYKYAYNNGNMAADPKLASLNFLNALERIPKYIEQYKTSNESLERDIPILHDVVNGTWRKEADLKILKSELSALERKIQLSLKASEAGQTQENDLGVNDNETSALAKSSQEIPTNNQPYSIANHSVISV